jgi:hypothetical protein
MVPVHFFVSIQARTLNTLSFNPPMRFSQKKNQGAERNSAERNIAGARFRR